MANYWAIAIGINQYRCFQPLMYAQRDAREIGNYWIHESGFGSEQTILLTDELDDESSPTFPNRDNIANAIVRICQQLKPDDVFWCFFSGYGVHFQGKDYLMPEEGNPMQVLATGIPMESIFATLSSASSRNIVLVMDANRYQSTFEAGGFGQETMALASQHSIATILSCRPDQFSYETLALRHGLFTMAVLEGLRYHGCCTASHLVQYLSNRLPTLCDHCWRPVQNVMVTIPDLMQHQLVIPERALATVGASTLEGTRLSSASMPSSQMQWGQSSSNSLPLTPTSTLEGGTTAGFNGLASQNGSGSSTATTSPVPRDGGSPASLEDEDDGFWRIWTPRILGVASILVLAVLLLNRAAFTNDTAPPVGDPAAPSNTTTNYLRPPSGQAPAPSSAVRPAPANQTEPTVPIAPGAANPQEPELSPFISTIPDPTPENGAGSEPGQIQQAVQSQRYGDASALLTQIPENQRPDNYTALLQQVNQGLMNQAQIAISRPRRLTTTNQASDFNAAIQLASKIQQGQPLYVEAQQAIDTWSQTILELAKSRAAQPNRGSSQVAAQNYSAAIYAANLVPTSRPELYAAAQQLSASWSQTILGLAKNRAAEGRFDVAIRTAQAIPANTPIYPAAQQAIAQWKAQ